MAAVKLAVSVEPVDHDHGHWCRDCRLSTGVRFVVATRVGEEPPRLHTALVCLECEGRDVVVDAEPRRCSGHG